MDGIGADFFGIHVIGAAEVLRRELSCRNGCFCAGRVGERRLALRPRRTGNAGNGSVPIVGLHCHDGRRRGTHSRSARGTREDRQRTLRKSIIVPGGTVRSLPRRGRMLNFRLGMWGDECPTSAPWWGGTNAQLPFRLMMSYPHFHFHFHRNLYLYKCALTIEHKSIDTGH